MTISSRFDPGVDVVMVSYRTPGDALRFVDSFEQQEGVSADLTVVDVDPVDDQLDGVVESYVATSENIGYGRACNFGSSWGRREVLAFFNADVILDPGSLAECYRALVDNDWAILGPRQTNSKGQITHAGIFGTLDAPRHRGWMDRDRGQYSDVREDAVTVSGSAYFIKREVWNALKSCPIFRKCFPFSLGAFGVTPHYYEESVCSWHAHGHGYRIAYYGPVHMVHEWHRASPVGGWAERVMPESRRIFRDFCDAHGIPRD